MSWAVVTLDYFANPTGSQTAAQLAASMQATALAMNTTFITSILGATVISIVGSVVGGRARLRIVLNINTATFQLRFPFETNIGAGIPSVFDELYTGLLRSAINQPVLPSRPVFTGS